MPETLSEYYINLESQVGARNYGPQEAVLSYGKGVFAWDVDGNKYIDMLSGYSALSHGHRHPRIVAAAKRQLDRLTLTSRAFYNDQLGPFLEELTGLARKDKALPMNSGAEAVETALKMTRKWGYQKKGIEPGKAEIITCEGNFHGRTISVISFSTDEQSRDGFGPFTPGYKTVEYGNVDSLREAITENTAGFLVEPIQGEGGVKIPPPGYLAEAYQVCKENNVLFMADEIQTGLGRTGDMFASWHEKVNPDVLIVGKALSGGLFPVSAVLADKEVMGVFNPGDHGSTFGGAPLAAAVSREALRVLIEEGLVENAQEMGKYFMAGLNDIKSDKITQIRGKGLLVGVEIDNSLTDAHTISGRLLEEGVLAKDAHGVIRFAPPLIIQEREVDYALRKIKKAFK